MRKVFEYLFAIACFCAIILACAERPDGSCCFWWSLSCIAFGVVCYFIWQGLTPKIEHIPDEVYSNLNKQICDYVFTQTEGDYEKAAFDYDGVSVLVEIRRNTVKDKFTDYAWGYPQTFTEINYSCDIEVVEVTVIDENGKQIESDFDSSLITDGYESTSWE